MLNIFLNFIIGFKMEVWKYKTGRILIQGIKCKKKKKIVHMFTNPVLIKLNNP